MKNFSIHTYRDVKAVLDTAFAALPAESNLDFPTDNEAITWLSRANRFRVGLRRADEERFALPPGQGSSIFDNMILSRRGSSINIREREMRGTLRVAGEVVEPKELDQE